MNKKTKETLAPIGLLLGVIALWQLICVVIDISDFILPSPWAIAQALVEYAGPIATRARRLDLRIQPALARSPTGLAK